MSWSAAMALAGGAQAQPGQVQAAAPAAQAATAITPATTSAVAPAVNPAVNPAVSPAVSLAVTPAARPADVATVDGIVAALYDVISGPAGQPRDWDRMRSLFAPEGRLMAVGARPEGVYALRAMTVDDYIARNSKAFATMGFFEREAARSTETFGQIVHVFSTYESRHNRGDAEPFQRGINSIQLYHDGKRWWIVNVLWRAEDASLRLPDRYLPRR
jgi:hypothetical protein